MAEERTEQPTQYRRRRFRERGVVAYSRDLTAAASLLGAWGALRLLGGWMGLQLVRSSSALITSAGAPSLNAATLGAYAVYLLELLAKVGGPVLLAAALGALAAGLLQTGGLVSFFTLLPTAEKINPLVALRRLFSWQGLFEVGKSVVEMVVLLEVAWRSVGCEWAGWTNLGSAELGAAGRHLVRLAMLLAWRCALVMLLIGALDYAFQWWQTERRMRMTRQELREEWKEVEEDPLTALRRRRRRRELSEQRITAELRQATVVVTNPAHLAVALRYQLHLMPAPKVVAKGRDFVAQRIVSLARLYRVPIVENVALAQVLYKSVRVGEFIPRALYQAVAEILALVYRRRLEQQRKRQARSGAQ
jgi:flagellar biosynthetic protein FlhB